MAVTIDSNKKIYIKKGDTVSLIVNTVGIIKAEVGDTAVFMIKESVSDLDEDAVVNKDIEVTTANEISIELSSTETEDMEAKTYYWSVKHNKGVEKYIIVPDEGDERYPAFIVGGTLIKT